MKWRKKNDALNQKLHPMVFHSGTAPPPRMKPFADKKTKNMKAEIIQSLTNDFESYARQTESGVEFWLAREVQLLLGYEQWKNFKTVIDKARAACEMAEHRVSNHFADAGKTIKMPKGVRTTSPTTLEPEGVGTLVIEEASRLLA